MTAHISKVLLLGPQRFQPTLGSAVRSLGIEGTIATITAGWQERETEDDELRDHLGGRTVNLRLHERADQVFAADPSYAAAHHERQERLRELQDLYCVRLDHEIAAVRALAARDATANLVAVEIADAIQNVRRLDERHLGQIREIHGEFETAWNPLARPAIAKHRRELAAILESSDALALAGGHVAVLLNRVRMFGIQELAGGRPVIAWSAGAMILAERVVIYHDTPPHGAGNAEVLDIGLGVFPGVVPLPHARRRLDLADRARVSFFARRFAPLVCVAMDREAKLVCDSRGCTAAPGTMRLAANGSLAPMVHA